MPGRILWGVLSMPLVDRRRCVLAAGRVRPAPPTIAVFLAPVLLIAAGLGLPACARPTAALAAVNSPAPPELSENLELLTGPNSLKARRIGARRLLDMPGSAGIAGLRQLLEGQPEPAAVQAVALAVLDTAKPPLELGESLLKWLAAQEPAVRDAVVAALVAYRGTPLVEKLRRVAAQQALPQHQRLAAVAVLARMADKQAMAALVDLLGVPDEQVRQAAHDALAQIAKIDFGSDLAAWRRWWQANKDRQPVEWLAELNESLTKQNRRLTEQLRTLTARLVKALREVYHAAPEADRAAKLIAYLGDPIPEVRLLGIELVNGLITDGKAVSPEAASQLRRLLDDPDSRVRLQTVQVIRDLRHRDDAKLLLGRFERETDPAVRRAIVKALGWLGDPAAADVLLKCLREDDADLPAASASALGLLCQRSNGSGSAGDVLDRVAAALKERFAAAKRPQEATLRQAILEAMAKIADDRFRPELLAALKSPEPAARQAAVEALARLAQPDDPALIRPFLADAEPTVREAACRALASIGTQAELPALVKRCDEQAESAVAVRKAAKDAAVSVIMRLKPVSAESALAGLANSTVPAAVWADVLEAASARALAAQATDKRLLRALTAALAEAKYAAGDKQAAVALWVQVLADRPTDRASSALAAVLVELGEPDRIRAALERLAGQPEALTGLLNGLREQVQAREAAGQQRAFLRGLPEALKGLDVSDWPPAAQEAMRAFLEACQARPAASAPASRPAATRPAGSVTTQKSQP